MSFNKKILAAAIVSGLFATSAHAQVTISDTTPVPVRIASEANFTAGDLLVSNPTGLLNLRSEFGYAFSDGEVRHARIECSSNMEFTTATVDSDNVNTSFGAVNGVGTNAIHFSITSDAGANAVMADDLLIIDGTRTFTSRDAVNCTYSLYDQPSQAASGGATGRIATASGAYATFVTSYVYGNTANSSTANVEASPSFSSFVLAGNPTGVTGIAQIGRVNFNVRSSVPNSGTTPLDTDGAMITLADILATGTSHVVTGDFSAAANANGTFTGATALNRVFFSINADCSTVNRAADAITASSATFVLDDAPIPNWYLCYTPRAGQAIPASTYTITLAPISEPNYTASPAGPAAVGSIMRNGTELQAPLAQVPPGWLSRMVLTNTGSVARPYTVMVMSETGNTVGTANLTGTVPANGTTVVDLSTVLVSFTGQRRATLIANIAGPNNQVQGLYQIVNPEQGSISNHVMVRPGTN